MKNLKVKAEKIIREYGDRSDYFKSKYKLPFECCYECSYKLYIKDDTLLFKVSYNSFGQVVTKVVKFSKDENIFLEEIKKAIDEVVKNATIRVPF